MLKKVSLLVARMYKKASKLGSTLVNKEESIPKFIKMIVLVGFFAASTLITWWYLRDKNLTMLNPHGTIGLEQRKIINVALLLSIIIVVPVFTMAFFIYTKYRADNAKAKYQPNWDHNGIVETIWWAIPIIIIGILSVITWKSSHDLDPFKPIVSNKKTLTVEVIALDWKWLFLYPDQAVASVNEVHIPVDTPVDFKVTSDAPMNSFWIPELGSQIYAMSGMTTHLNAMATSPGTYDGASANISGKGFSGMKFKVIASSETDFTNWANTVHATTAGLGPEEYKHLALPSENDGVSYYGLADMSIFDKVLLKYMNATSTSQSTELRDYGSTK